MPAAQHDLVARLTNRSAWLSLASALFFFVGLVTFGTAVQKTEDVAVRALSGAPLGVALGGAMWARGTRSRLRSLRHEADAMEQTTESAVVAGGSALPGRDEGSGSSPVPPAHP